MEQQPVTVTTLEYRRPQPLLWPTMLLLVSAALWLAACQPPAQTETVCFACTAEACEAAPCELDVPPATPFTTGEIDLTGDGISETVHREGTRAWIEENGETVWATADTWEVVDAALGDPNDDGRGELLLAFWRDDAEGVPRSHPFIIGYRKGIYQALWGGSAVSESIHELALGDLDGDGVEELVVLEDAGGDGRTLGLWRWHGWGFSLMWRSEPGAYSGLVLVPSNGSGPGSVSVTRVP